MPLVTLNVRKPKSSEFKTAVFAAVHQGLMAAGVPETDRFQRVLELDADDFRFDPKYPDVKTSRTDDFVLIEILLSVGRSAKIKRQIIDPIIAGLARDPGLDPENVMIVFTETQWESWVFAGGRRIHVPD